MTGRIIVQPFDRTRSRNTFECGRRGIDQWYRNHSKKWSDRAEARITIAVDEDTNAVAGFHALQIGSESMAELENKPDDHTKNYTAFPALHLAYLGVQKEYQRKGVGTILLKDVIDKAYKVSLLAGLYALTLQSIDRQSTMFYESLGFEPYTRDNIAPKMLIPIRTIIDLVEGGAGG
ncbi:GNAT family N-acetyltransferase (plasmid) [Methylobacterium sp. CB376]|uniref:GNAT family N-acetyltransferase n=1 Tax=unclassified Methylobacterium TaxID=2615210 RepID=UPI00143B792E|nr:MULTISPECIES: GNAT family N-acetyltransferase [Methylobacterium]WFT83801.1 GNAT family N-acetyltransferase [Methylobacterium nodulans]